MSDVCFPSFWITEGARIDHQHGDSVGQQELFLPLPPHGTVRQVHRAARGSRFVIALVSNRRACIGACIGKTPLSSGVLSLYLYLSRACLGKVIAFSINLKTAQKGQPVSLPLGAKHWQGAMSSSGVAKGGNPSVNPLNLPWCPPPPPPLASQKEILWPCLS